MRYDQGGGVAYFSTPFTKTLTLMLYDENNLLSIQFAHTKAYTSGLQAS